LPLDWSPTATIWGRGTYSPTPLENNLSILFRRMGSAVWPTAWRWLPMLGMLMDNRRPAREEIVDEG
jgi:hypothetical protein